VDSPNASSGLSAKTTLRLCRSLHLLAGAPLRPVPLVHVADWGYAPLLGDDQHGGYKTVPHAGLSDAPSPYPSFLTFCSYVVIIEHNGTHATFFRIGKKYGFRCADSCLFDNSMFG
jgi:hypothetical protein